MTRINIAIPPKALDDWRLIAEINEIHRIPELYQKRLEKKVNFGDIPKHFTLSIGHVKFFLNKGAFILNRFNILVDEYEIRNLSNIYNNKINKDVTEFLKFKEEHFNTWNPKKKDVAKVITRIIETIKNSDKLPMYKGFYEPKKVAIDRILSIGIKPEKKQEQTKLFN